MVRRKDGLENERYGAAASLPTTRQITHLSGLTSLFVDFSYNLTI